MSAAECRSRRRRASFHRRCVRLWFRHQGRQVRLLWIEDYSPCEQGGQPRCFFKLLAHTRYPAGIQATPEMSAFYSNLLPLLPVGQWTEVVIA